MSSSDWCWALPLRELAANRPVTLQPAKWRWERQHPLSGSVDLRPDGFRRPHDRPSVSRWPGSDAGRTPSPGRVGDHADDMRSARRSTRGRARGRRRDARTAIPSGSPPEHFCTSPGHPLWSLGLCRRRGPRVLSVRRLHPQPGGGSWPFVRSPAEFLGCAERITSSTTGDN